MTNNFVTKFLRAKVAAVLCLVAIFMTLCACTEVEGDAEGTAPVVPGSARDDGIRCVFEKKGREFFVTGDGSFYEMVDGQKTLLGVLEKKVPDGTITDKNTFSHTFSDEYMFYLDFQGLLHAFPLSGNMKDKYPFPENTNILTDEFAAVMWYDDSLVCIRYDDKEYKFEPYILDEKNEYYSVGEPTDSGYYFRGLLKIVAGENSVFYYTADMTEYVKVEIP